MKAKFKVGNDKRRDPQYIKGCIIKEYANFYLIETNSGYRECVNKAFLRCGDIERVV